MRPIMVTMIVIAHAQPFPFNRPYDTIKYAIPRINITMPIAIGIAPRDASSEASGELALVCPISVKETDNSAPSPMRVIPPIIIRIAIIVTPIGHFVFVVKLKPKLLLNRVIC